MTHLSTEPRLSSFVSKPDRGSQCCREKRPANICPFFQMPPESLAPLASVPRIAPSFLLPRVQASSGNSGPPVKIGRGEIQNEGSPHNGHFERQQPVVEINQFRHIESQHRGHRRHGKALIRPLFSQVRFFVAEDFNGTVRRFVLVFCGQNDTVLSMSPATRSDRVDAGRQTGELLASVFRS